VAFHSPMDAVSWALHVQLALLQVAWPHELLQHPLAKQESGSDNKLLFRGLRVRMAINTGVPVEIIVSLCFSPGLATTSFRCRHTSKAYQHLHLSCHALPLPMHHCINRAHMTPTLPSPGRLISQLPVLCTGSQRDQAGRIQRRDCGADRVPVTSAIGRPGAAEPHHLPWHLPALA